MRLLRIGAYLLLAVLAIAAGAYVAFRVSPWPSVLLIRHAFDADAAARNRALDLDRPAGIAELTDQPYGDGADEKLDVFRPAAAAQPGARLPAVIWIHGGAFIAGDKRDLAGYLRRVAGLGYVAVGVGYSIAPGARYPTPVLQANRALGYVIREAARLDIDPARIVLAGDSAGSQIAAQLAAASVDPAYAARTGFEPAAGRERLRGVVLFCGVYDASAIRRDGPFGHFIETVLWSYFGEKNPDRDPRMADFSVNRRVTSAFPPTFVSVGNADPLAPQSMLMIDALRHQGVEVDTLLFPADHAPPLQHEYQFDLGGDAGRRAFERLGAFLAAHTR